MWISETKPAVILAPMEGVTDWPMRTLLTRKGGYSHCVSEFIRLGHEMLPRHFFYRVLPELKTGGRTPSGVPVQVQLMGGDPELLAQSAVQLVGLGALGIDLNFGCPSHTVNRRDAGAVLLKYPHRLYEIVARVRDAVPPSVPVSAKVRLGWDHTEAIFENADSIEKAGASWLTVHARTKAQGYAPPVHWDRVGKLREQVRIPVVVNGDIASLDQFLACQKITGCLHYMIGRGALADPSLVHSIGAQLEGKAFSPTVVFQNAFSDWLPLFRDFSELCFQEDRSPEYTVRRMKQWMNLASKRHPFPGFEDLKKVSHLDEMLTVLGKKADQESLYGSKARELGVGQFS